MAKSLVRYSKLFKTKISISGGMAIASILYFLMVLVIPADKDIGYLNSCSKKPYLIIYLIQCAAWSFGTLLMLAEY